MDCYQTNRPRLSFEDQHEALLMLSLNCWPQGTLEKAGRSVDHQVTTDMAECPVSNTCAVPDDHCGVLSYTSNMGKTKKQGEH